MKNKLALLISVACLSIAHAAPPTTEGILVPAQVDANGNLLPVTRNGHDLNLPAGTKLNGATLTNGGVAWGGITGTLSSQTDLQNALNAKALDSAVIHNTGNETVAGIKTFSSAPVVPDNSFAESKVTSLLTDLAAKVSTSTTVNSHALSSNVIVTPGDLSLTIGTNVEAWSANLDSWSALATSSKLTAASNLSDVANAGTSRTNLGATTVGGNIFTLTNPSAISFVKIAADNSVSTRTPTQLVSDLGLVIGTNVQAYSANLTTFAGLTLDTDGTLAANSDTRVASQKATKTYADTKAPQTTTINGHALSGNVTVKYSDLNWSTDNVDIASVTSAGTATLTWGKNYYGTVSATTLTIAFAGTPAAGGPLIAGTINVTAVGGCTLTFPSNVYLTDEPAVAATTQHWDTVLHTFSVTLRAASQYVWLDDQPDFTNLFVIGTNVPGDIGALATANNLSEINSAGSAASEAARQNLNVPFSNQVAVSSSFAVTSASDGNVFDVTTGSSAIVATLDATTLYNGFWVALRKVDSGSGLLTNNKTTAAIGMINQLIEISCDGTNYYQRYIGGGTNATADYTLSSAGLITFTPAVNKDFVAAVSGTGRVILDGVTANSMLYVDANNKVQPVAFSGATFSSGTLTITGGGGDTSTNTTSSVDGQHAYFSGTGGKTLRRSNVYTLAADAIDTITAGNAYVYDSSTPLTATHVITMPAASSYVKGEGFWYNDNSGILGNASGYKYTFTRAGSDTVNGSATGFDVTVAYAQRYFSSDGTSNWTIAAFTQQGNSFNGVSQLVKTNANGAMAVAVDNSAGDPIGVVFTRSVSVNMMSTGVTNIYTTPAGYHTSFAAVRQLMTTKTGTITTHAVWNLRETGGPTALIPNQTDAAEVQGQISNRPITTAFATVPCAAGNSIAVSVSTAMAGGSALQETFFVDLVNY